MSTYTDRIVSVTTTFPYTPEKRFHDIVIERTARTMSGRRRLNSKPVVVAFQLSDDDARAFAADLSTRTSALYDAATGAK